MTRNPAAAGAATHPTEPTHHPIVHDGNGTWFTPDDLFFTALTDDELELLDLDGDESVLDDVPFAEVGTILREAFAGHEYLDWRAAQQ